MNREQLIELAKNCGYWSGQTIEMNDVGIEQFANLVAAAERDKVAQWMIQKGYATEPSDTIEDLLEKLERRAVGREMATLFQKAGIGIGLD
jgi:endonuclease YncB( thermonuclease family)